MGVQRKYPEIKIEEVKVTVSSAEGTISYNENLLNEKERAEAQKNAYFYASVLRKQKTIDFLMNL